ncbi:MAG: PilZ domain-containing protein [Candidatus Omnitrophota bacterium]
MMQEKRRFVRSDGLVLVDYRGTKIEGKCSAFDVSGVGVRLIIDKKLDMGAAVEIELYLPGDSQALSAKGKVVWVQKCRETEESEHEKRKEFFYIGIEFDEIEEKNRKRITGYVYRRTH